MVVSDRAYIAIDLKSFYASVECVERQLNPLTTNLVVADKSRTEKTICLAVSPSLKAHGIPGRARLFEVVERTRQVNAQRRQTAPGHAFRSKSVNALELKADSALELDYIVAVPRMQLYEDYSTRIYSIYLKYFAPESIHVYSIDEVMIDATGYLSTYRMTARELTRKIILDILKTTGITATAGIGTNLYLCKVAMDVVAKHVEADASGVPSSDICGCRDTRASKPRDDGFLPPIFTERPGWQCRRFHQFGMRQRTPQASISPICRKNSYASSAVRRRG